MRRILRISLVAALLVAVGCSGCPGRKASRTADEFVSADASGALSVSSLGDLADRSQSLLGTVRANPGGDRLVKLAANISRQVGFDPLHRDGLKEAGINPAGSFALAVDAAGAFMVIPVGDQKTLEATVARLAETRTGAKVRESRTIDGVKVTVHTLDAGGAPEFAYTIRDGYLLLSAGEGGDTIVSRAALRTAEESIARSELHARARQKIGEREAYVFLLRGGSPAANLLPDVVSMGLGVSARELSLRGYLALLPDHAKGAAEILSGGGKDLLAKLPGDLPAYLRGGLDLKAVVARLDASGLLGPRGLAALRESASEVGIDLDADVVENIEPGFALGVGLSPTMNLTKAFSDPRRSNPFQHFTVLGAGRVKDGARATAALDKLAQTLEDPGVIGDVLGAKLSTREVDGMRLYTVKYHLGDGMSFAFKGSDVAVLAGFGEQTEAVATAVVGGAQKGPQAADFSDRGGRALFGDEGLALALSMNRVTEAIEKLPNTAFGKGPSAMMARSVTTSVIKPFAPLQAALLLEPTDGGVIVELSAAVK